jgi:hypothetical protein
MSRHVALASDLARLVELFRSHCQDQETLNWLHRATEDRARWKDAHGVVNHIRTKYLKAEKRGDEILMAQYIFEEVCAKTIYNMSGMPAPFDADSPYWVVPNAISLARELGLGESSVIECLGSTFQRQGLRPSAGEASQETTSK